MLNKKNLGELKMSDKSTAMKKMRQPAKQKKRMEKVAQRLGKSKLAQKVRKTGIKAAKLTNKIPTLKDPAKRQKAIQRLSRVNQRSIKRGTKLSNRFNKQVAKSGRSRPIA